MKTELMQCRKNEHYQVLFHPVMLSHFGPAPVKTDRAVRIQ